MVILVLSYVKQNTLSISHSFCYWFVGICAGAVLEKRNAHETRKSVFLQARDYCEVIMILYKDRLIYLQGSEVRRKVDFQNNCIHFNASKYMDEFH